MCLVQSPRAVPASRASPCLRSKMCYVCRAVPACRACVSGCAACAVPFACRAVPAFQGAKKSRAVHECSAVPAWRAMPASIRKEKICSAWPCPRTVPAYRARAPCHAAPCQRSRMRKNLPCCAAPCPRALPCRAVPACRAMPASQHAKNVQYRAVLAHHAAPRRATPRLRSRRRQTCGTAPRRACVPECTARARQGLIKHIAHPHQALTPLMLTHHVYYSRYPCAA